MTDDRVTAALEEIRKEAAVFGWSSAGAGRLLAAVDGAMAVADHVTATSSPGDPEYHAAEAFRAAISSALLGEVAPDA
jgi:hypothetical protein